MKKENDKKQECVSKEQIEAFSRFLYPVILDYFDSKEGQEALEKWKKKQKRVVLINLNITLIL